MAFVSTDYFYKLDDLNVRSFKANIPGGNPEASDADFWDIGWGRLWEDTPARPGEFYTPSKGPLVVNAPEKRVERVDTWEEWSEAEKAESLSQQIDEQVLNASVQQTVVDPTIEKDISRYSAAAEDKHIELQEVVEAEGDLDAFDPTLDVTSPQNGKGYSQFAVSIIELEPWVGAPDDNLGFEAVLNVQTDYEDQGAEARLYVVDAPSDVTAVLPFTQDADDPKLWTVTARQGHMWQDPEISCTVQLLWGASNLQTSRKLKCKEKYDRKSAMVRYAVASTKIKKGKKIKK